MLPPSPPQTRTCGFPASGSSRESFAGDGVAMDDPRAGKRVACEQRGEAVPWEGLRARPPFQPLLPGPCGLPEVPAQLLHVPRDAVIGIVTFELRRQPGELGAQRLMAVSPAPVVDGDQRAA